MTSQRMRTAHPAGTTATWSDLAGMNVRELVTVLSQVEDDLRVAPVMVQHHGMMVVNPEVAPLLARQRAAVAHLRQRRVAWHTGAPGGRRSPSASWPVPPWG